MDLNQEADGGSQEQAGTKDQTIMSGGGDTSVKKEAEAKPSARRDEVDSEENAVRNQLDSAATGSGETKSVESVQLVPSWMLMTGGSLQKAWAPTKRETRKGNASESKEIVKVPENSRSSPTTPNEPGPELERDPSSAVSESNDADETLAASRKRPAATPHKKRTASPKRVKFDRDNSEKEVAQASTDSGEDAEVPKRQSCSDGIGCFSRNQAHRNEFAHPGDIDFAEVAEVASNDEEEEDDDSAESNAETDAGNEEADLVDDINDSVDDDTDSQDNSAPIEDEEFPEDSVLDDEPRDIRRPKETERFS